MAPSPVRAMRRVLRYRNLVVRQATRMKNRIAGLLMETGTPYAKQRLHGKAYFGELLGSLRQMPDAVVELLKLSRGQLELFESIQRRLLRELRERPELSQRVERLQSIPSVGEILSLTWALEIGEVSRFSSIGEACSYCGLTSAERNSAGVEQRGTISKQRNKHLQTILDPDRGRQARPTLQPAASGGARAGAAARESQSGDAGGGAQVGGVFDGRG